MSLVSFQGDTYLQRGEHWFLWESAWGMFRPITALQWDGIQFRKNDKPYCLDPLDELFGFGTMKMKEACTLLTDMYESKLESALPVASLCIGPATWIRDRQVSLTPCAPSDLASWKRLCSGRAKTCKQSVPRQRFTKRNL